MMLVKLLCHVNQRAPIRPSILLYSCALTIGKAEDEAYILTKVKAKETSTHVYTQGGAGEG